MAKITEDQFLEWKEDNPITLAVLEVISKSRDFEKSKGSDFHYYSAGNPNLTNEKIAHSLGIIAGLEEVLDIDFSAIEEPEDERE